MLIRSQNKKILVILNQATNISIISRDSKFKIMAYYSCDDGYDCMGEYSTEEKAIKVLDMIQSAYETSLYSDHGFDNAAQIMRPYVFINNRVYQMPQDSEDGE